MNILVACEESQEVCKAMRNKGHIAFSCDIQKCSGGHPEWHIWGDLAKVLNGKCIFKTEDGKTHSFMSFRSWDMIIAFPPCTHLAVSGARHFEKKREDGRQLDAIKFFEKILNADCEKIVVENPVNIIGSDYIKKWYPNYSYLSNCTQKIQPYEYGDPFRKTTCLWLKNVEPLKPTKIVEPKLVTYISKKTGKKSTFSEDYGFCKSGSERSKTYHGIAIAMADQWG